MIPAAFDYHSPTTLDEALALLAQHGDKAKILAGGQSLLPMLKLRLGQAGVLIDIGRVPGLDYIKEEAGTLKIGAATRESALERSELIRSKYPILLDTAAVIADPLVRNRATVGGNLAHSDPANDHPATMLALGATVVARGTIGIEADQAGEPAGAAVHFVHDLFVVDSLKQLPSEGDSGGFAPLSNLVQKAVGYQL